MKNLSKNILFPFVRLIKDKYPMTEKIIYKLLDPTSFNLKLNDRMPKFALISELLLHYAIPFQSWTPLGSLKLEVVEMEFSLSCNFQDIYLLAYLFKDFGLEEIYPSRKKEVDISIGTYLHHADIMDEFAFAEPIKINDFLSLDPKLSTQLAFNLCFKNKFAENYIQEYYVSKNEEADEYCEPEDEYIVEYSNNENESYNYGDPRYDSNENPWIDVFGEGDEAETAYWNTD